MARKKIVFLNLFILLFFTLSLWADVVMSYRGKAYAKSGHSTKWHKVKIKEILKPGDMVMTKAKSKLTLSILDSGGIITIQENSKLLITQQVIKKNTVPKFLLFLGKLKGKISKKQSNQIDFDTPTAVAGIRGTIFDIAVADEGTAKIGVTRGEVAVSGLNQSVSLGPNESSVVPFAGDPQDKIAYSENENLSQWQTDIAKEISGNEMAILARVESVLENNYQKIDKLDAENSANLKEIEKLKLKRKNLNEDEQKTEGKKIGAEITQIIGKRSRIIVASYNLDYRNQSIFEIAERIFKKNKTNKDIKTKYNQIKVKYAFYHAKFVKTPKKKGCLFF